MGEPPTPRFRPLGAGPFRGIFDDFTEAVVHWDIADTSPDADTRALGRRTFQARALDEQRSLVAFSDLLSMLGRSGAPIEIIGSLTRVVRDEALHVDLCDRMVQRLGGWDAHSKQPAFVSFPTEWSLDKRILATVLGSLCVGETLSVALFRSAREHATDPVAHQILTRMMKDESYHARFGWWWLDAIPRSPGAQQFAETFVASVLRSVVEDFLPSQGEAALLADGLPTTATPHGGIPAEERRAVVLDAMETQVLLGFEKAGIPARAIFEEALRNPVAPSGRRANAELSKETSE